MEQLELQKTDGKSVLREYIESIAIAAVLTTFIILFIARSFVVDGPSMQPTLFTSQRVLVSEVGYRLGQPHRGDIVVCYQPEEKRRLIKRVVGIPDDVVEVRGGKLYVNSIRIDEKFLSEPINEDYGPVMVPEGQYLVMGDNRNNSEDGRRFGALDKKYIIGRAIIRFWPVYKTAVFVRPAEYTQYNRQYGRR